MNTESLIVEQLIDVPIVAARGRNLNDDDDVLWLSVSLTRLQEEIASRPPDVLPRTKDCPSSISNSLVENSLLRVYTHAVICITCVYTAWEYLERAPVHAFHFGETLFAREFIRGKKLRSLRRQFSVYKIYLAKRNKARKHNIYAISV